jgi:Domain of unknown function (DUF4258)
MVLIDEIREKIEAGQFEFSKHAVDQSIIRRISVKEIQELFDDAEVIEDYPEDKYGPSCLILGKTRDGRPCISNAATPRGHLSRSSRFMNQVRSFGLILGYGENHE